MSNGTNTKGRQMNATKTTYTFRKVERDGDARDVVVGGIVVGRIHYGWNRNGGWGWCSNVIGKTYRSMTDAADDMQRRARRV